MSTFVQKFMQIADSHPDLLFQQLHFVKERDGIRDISIDSGQSSSNHSGSWVKRVLKIQKLLKRLELNLQPREDFSLVSDCLCAKLKDNLRYGGSPKSNGSFAMFADPTVIDEAAEFDFPTSS